MNAEELRAELHRRGIRQGEVALKMNLRAGTLSTYLSGNAPMPDGFAARFMEAVDAVAQEKVARLLRTA